MYKLIDSCLEYPRRGKVDWGGELEAYLSLVWQSLRMIVKEFFKDRILPSFLSE